MSDNGREREGWIVVPLREVVEQRSERADPAANAGLPFVGMDHVESGSRRIIGSVPSENMKSTAKKFEHGDVLYGRLRPYLNKVARPDFQGLASAEFIVLRSAGSLSPAFLEYRLSAHDFVSYASHQGEGDRPRVSYEQIAGFEVAVPPQPEQERIIDAIDELFSQIDAGVASLESAQVKLDRYRASVLKAAVEGKLTVDWREENPDVEPADELLKRILAERRKRWEEEQLAKYEAKGKKPPKGWKEKYKEPAEAQPTEGIDLPTNWVWATVDQISEAVRYGTSAKTSAELAGIPVLRMGNIQEGKLDVKDLKYLPDDHDEFPGLLLQPGDLLFNRTNSPELVGKSAVYEGTPQPCSYASYLIAVRPLPGCLSSVPTFFLNSPHGRRWVSRMVSQQVGQANVNGTKLKSMAFPLMPLEEQHRLVEVVEELLSPQEAQVMACERSVTRAERLRQSILVTAFRGDLVPQDPADEPASELIKRIKAEREASGNGGSGRKGRKKRKSPDPNQGYTLIPKSPDE